MKVFNHGHNSIEEAGHVFAPRRVTEIKKKVKLTNPRLEVVEESSEDDENKSKNNKSDKPKGKG